MESIIVKENKSADPKSVDTPAEVDSAEIEPTATQSSEPNGVVDGTLPLPAGAVEAPVEVDRSGETDLPLTPNPVTPRADIASDPPGV